jgi:Holliday junction resolvase
MGLSRDKGARAETVVRDALRKLTGLNFERVPGSGALDEKHFLKGDLYLPNLPNVFCIEVKHYKDDTLDSKILSGKNPQLIEFWKQTTRQALQVKRLPLLIFKHDRSKLFVGYEALPSTDEYNHVFISCNGYEFFVSLLEDWIKYENPSFT